jgi:hypothetical protein
MAVEVVLGAIGAVASLSAGLAKTWVVHRESKRNSSASIAVQPGNGTIKQPPVQPSSRLPSS